MAFYGMLPRLRFYYKTALCKSQEFYQKKSKDQENIKKMCEICHMTFCPSACPNGEDLSAERCPACEMPLYEGEGIKAPDGSIYCKDCISEMDIYDILQICEIKDAVSLLKILENIK